MRCLWVCIDKMLEFMRSHGLFDLESKKGKAPGGYEAYVPGIKAPFIFSNFNGTSGDIDVLTHEFGHALQAFLGSSYVGIHRRLHRME